MADKYRRARGPGCSLLAAVQTVVDAWCRRAPAAGATGAKGEFCFAHVEEALFAADLKTLGGKSSQQLDEICAEESCFRSNLQYLDAITLLQAAWRLMHAPAQEAGENEGEFNAHIFRARRLAEALDFDSEEKGEDDAPLQRLAFHSTGAADARERAETQLRAVFRATASLTGLEVPEENLKTSPAASRRAPPRRLSSLSRFQGPLGETLEEGLDLVCTKVQGDYCQQTLALLAQESPVRTPSLLLQPCASRCFVPLTGAVGSVVEVYGQRYRDPTHELLGAVMRAYSRFYCTKNERGDTCGHIFFDRYKAVNPQKTASQGIDLPLPDCPCPQSFLQVRCDTRAASLANPRCESEALEKFALFL